MKLPTPYQCDICGKPKGESNQWWLRLIGDLAELNDDLVGHRHFVFAPWDDGLAAENDPEDGLPLYEHICSQECASKALSKWMSTITSGKL